MAQAILCPQVGQDLTEAKVVEITVKLGDRVKKGDLVAVVESEKASFDVEAFAEGVVIGLPYSEGDTATVLEPLILLGEEGEVPVVAPPMSTAPGVKPDATAAAAPPGRVPAPAPAPTPSEHRPLRASPAARRAAEVAGLDLRKVGGTGPNGAVVMRDLEGAAPTHMVAATPGGIAALELRTLRAGQGDPVLLVHGFGADVSSWRVFATELPTDRPVLALDLPGHGASHDHSAGDFHTMAAALAATLPGAVHLVSHSLGSALCVRAASLSSAQVRSMTMLAPAGLGPSINGGFVEGFLAARTEAALAAWMQQLVYDPDTLPGVIVRATMSAREMPGVLAGQTRVAANLFEGGTQLFSVVRELAAYDGVATVIQGTGDRIIRADEVIGAIPPACALHRVPLSGHLPQIEAPGLVQGLVQRTIRAAG
jgi:pimeloyl-ACP methyl ester carboxylesterase